MASVDKIIDVSEPALAKRRSALKEQVRLLAARLDKSAIPEDGWELAPVLEESRLKLALINEITRLRDPGSISVMSLKWTPDDRHRDGLERLDAKTPFGTYTILFEPGRASVYFEDGGRIGDPHVDLEAAMAAAADDWSSKVRASLSV